MAGVRATTTNVAIAQTSSTNAGIALNVSDGSVNVAVTPAGTYQLTYRMCDLSNAANCDDATVTVTVNPYIVHAVNDAGWAGFATAPMPRIAIRPPHQSWCETM